MTTPQKVTRLTASRRTLLATAAGVPAAASVTGSAAWATTNAAPSTLQFESLGHGGDDQSHVAEGHTAQVVLKWGDGLYPDSPQWSAHQQTAAAQARQFGTDNDFIAFMPLPMGSNNSEHGLLCVNHESAFSQLMFRGVTGRIDPDLTQEQVDIQMASHGHSIVEVEFKDGAWAPVIGSRYNRRISPAWTEMELSGPAAGHARLKTKDDPSGRRVIGTLSNCAGGVTPWNTVLIAEENINQYFGGNPRGTPEEGNHLRMAITTELYYGWYRHYARFDVEKELNEPNRFGWMVEIDPYDPSSIPKKRTALGRFKHEGAGLALTPDGRVAVYMGDDQIFQFIYRFISTDAIDANNRTANFDMLDDGTLFVARFDEDGTLKWLPMTFGEGPLVPANGFDSQADVLIETRRAAELVGATPMDRPEDIEANPVTGTVYVSLTNNKDRTANQIDAANPRAKNIFGHMLELTPPTAGGNPDHAAETYTWRPFLSGGDPRDPDSGAMFHAESAADGWIVCPDNITFDVRGRLWIATDGAEDFGFADGVWATDVQGPGRAYLKNLFQCPAGAELTGPCFTPDGATLFVSVQHPGEGSESAYDNPLTRWPDFKDGVPPRAGVVAIRRKDGKSIG